MTDEKLTNSEEQKRLCETDIHLDFGRRLIRVEGVNDGENFVLVTVGSQTTTGELVAEHREELPLTAARRLRDRLTEVLG